ncbi:DNA gyrase inhibitor YacG [uncultured Parasphingopyxis sp.]|uniref:DNA gyrase inhibitor YacG n=1 Tax=uncultured Parasphingopyxis sp. TaxID=1547918 RepID=UPI00261597EC|nr:DNA gyrase inhibitor YacG [uncultured Parasphingopyxis sp.]
MPKRAQSCPICRKPPAAEFEPFCSRGCKDRDLLNWLGDGYRVPGPPVDPESIVGVENGVDSDR